MVFSTLYKKLPFSVILAKLLTYPFMEIKIIIMIQLLLLYLVIYIIIMLLMMNEDCALKVGMFHLMMNGKH